MVLLPSLHQADVAIPGNGNELAVNSELSVKLGWTDTCFVQLVPTAAAAMVGVSPSLPRVNYCAYGLRQIALLLDKMSMISLERHDWVIPSLGPGLATQDPFESHPPSSEHAKAFDRLVGILGASRMKATEPLGHDEAQQAMIQGKCPLIEANERQDSRLEHRTKIPQWQRFV